MRSARRKVGEAEVVASATRAVREIVGLEILESQKRELLSVLLWKISEARGKYRTRFQSVAAQSESDVRRLHHDHVYPRARLVDAMLASPEKAAEIAQGSIGCVVTREEHARLSDVDRRDPSLSGWERYAAAGVDVVDTETGEVVEQGRDGDSDVGPT